MAAKKPKRQVSADGAYFEFVVALEHIRPRIWRRFSIRTDATFADLHEAIQLSFDWENCHLWDFRERGRRGNIIAAYRYDGDEDWGEARPDAATVGLSDYFANQPDGSKIHYLYDFGDDWLHSVTLKRRVDEPPPITQRCLLAGKRACPPEDCGGAGGYMWLLELLDADPDSLDDDDLDRLDWLGEYDPDAFELAAAKAWFDQ